MKAVLLLSLLAFISCEKDIMDIGKCIYKAPKVKELINDVVIAFATKDFSKLLPKIKEALPDLINIVIGCITEEKKAVEEAPKLKTDLPPLSECELNCNKKYNIFHLKERQACYKKC